MRRRLLPLLLVPFVVGATAAWFAAPTFDEPNHLEMGLRILRDGDFSRFDNSKMPVSVLNAVPALLLEQADPQVRWWAARLPQLLWLLGTVLLVHRWAGVLGSAAALAAAALIAVEPNLIAHSSLVTTDAPCVFFTLLACWTWARALEGEGARGHAIAGLCFGLAQAAKFTAAFLVPIHLLVALCWCALGRSLKPLRGAWAFVLVGGLALNGAYGFQGSFTPSDQVAWQSQLFEPLGERSLPLPVPRPWAEGLDWVKADDDRGHGNIYVDGDFTPDGQQDYYLRALGWKLPVPMLVLGALGLLAVLRDDLLRGDLARRREALAQLIPAVFLLSWFSLSFNFQLGVRYLLPVLPFVALWAARLPRRWVWIGAGYTLLSTLSWMPWPLAYFNERLWDRSQAWRHLADSNLDWGQTEGVREAWKREHPGGLADPPALGLGPLLLSANALTGVLGDPVRFACLREHLPPTEHLAYALYPYELSARDLEVCFPAVRAAGSAEGALPAGQHLVLLSFRGEASLQVGDRTQSAEGSGETLLGAVVYADQPFDVVVTHQGPEARLYLDGREVPIP